MKSTVILLALLASLPPLRAQEAIDSAAVARILDEGMNRSQVMELLAEMTDVYGPRLSWSPEYREAAVWAAERMRGLGFSNVRIEGAEPLGRAWSLRRYSATVIGRRNFPLLSFPKAWSPGVRATGDLIHLDAQTDSAVESYRGKLNGKFVLFDPPREVKAHFQPQATREADSTLLWLANADDPAKRKRRSVEQSPESKRRAMLWYRKMDLVRREGALGVLSASRGDGGNVFVQGASSIHHPDTPSAKRVSVFDPRTARVVPQVAVAAEHYNRLVRLLGRGERVRLEMHLEVAEGGIDSLYNVFAEIPGTDLADEIVMLGGHFDSWQGGTGATDDATGSAAAIEAARILLALDLKPRRTIRVALWGGEEQGLKGSSAYVKKYLGEKETAEGGSGAVRHLPAAEKFSVYFNHDNGTGKIRGVYLQGNEAARPYFRSWLAPFDSLGASTLTLENTGGTDHLPFDAIGLPGFQFIQDDIEYGTRTHHSTMDLYERIQADDMKQASTIMAAFAWHAATMDARFPRKPLPAPPPALPGSH